MESFFIDARPLSSLFIIGIEGFLPDATSCLKSKLLDFDADVRAGKDMARESLSEILVLRSRKI